MIIMIILLMKTTGLGGAMVSPFAAMCYGSLHGLVLITEKEHVLYFPREQEETSLETSLHFPQFTTCLQMYSILVLPK